MEGFPQNMKLLWTLPFQTEQNKRTLALAVFRYFNREIFGNRLEQNFCFEQESFKREDKNSLGFTMTPNDRYGTPIGYAIIFLHFAKLTTRELFIGTIAHEMCHQACHVIDRYENFSLDCHDYPPYLAWIDAVKLKFPNLDVD